MRFVEVVDKKELPYSNSKIEAWIEIYEWIDDKGKTFTEKRIVCHLYRNGSENQPLNLGECNDGSKFTSVNQAINQAKQIIDFLGD